MQKPALFRYPARGAALAVALFAVAAPAGAAVPGSALHWMLSSPLSSRSCQLSLRFNAEGAAGGLTLPAACRHTIPAVKLALSWSVGVDGAINLMNAGGQTVLSFGRQEDGTWRATDAAGQPYVLTPTTAPAESPPGLAAIADGPIALSTQPLDATTGTVIDLAENTKPAKTSAAETADPTAIAGRYAVMRGDRDTGCMVTLDADVRGKGVYRARLAPACRDQGIIIFDPVSWQTKGSTVKLTARKGHSIDLTRDASGTLVKMPQDAKALGLKRL